MKYNFSLLFIFFLVFFTFSQVENDTIKRDSLTIEQIKSSISIDLKWVKSIHDAMYFAKIEKKPVLIYFTGSDWCGPCIKLDEMLFHTEKFKNIADKNFILYTADFPRNSSTIDPEIIDDNNLLQVKHNITGFPAIVFVNYKGKEIQVSRGLSLLQHYYYIIDKVLAKYKKTESK